MKAFLSELALLVSFLSIIQIVVVAFKYVGLIKISWSLAIIPVYIIAGSIVIFISAVIAERILRTFLK